jgi:hypothetical protein
MWRLVSNRPNPRGAPGAFITRISPLQYRREVGGQYEAARISWNRIAGAIAFGFRKCIAGARSSRLDRRHHRQDRQVGIGRERGATSRAARKIARDVPRFGRLQVGSLFGVSRRHVGGVGNAKLPSVVVAYGFGQQWRNQRRRERTSFASRCCQGSGDCPWDEIRFRRSLSRRTSVWKACRSERLSGTVDRDKIMIAVRAAFSRRFPASPRTSL